MYLKDYNFKIININLLVCLILSSCNINMKNNNNANGTISEANALVTNDKKDAVSNKQFNMEKFQNSLHVLLNNVTDTQSIVNGKSEILLKRKSRNSEYVYLIEDINDGNSDFIHKNTYMVKK